MVSNNYYEGFGKSLYPQNYLNYIIIPPASLFLPFPEFVFLCLMPPSYTARQTWTQIRHFSAFLSRVPQMRLDASQGVICLTEPIIIPNLCPGAKSNLPSSTTSSSYLLPSCNLWPFSHGMTLLGDWTISSIIVFCIYTCPGKLVSAYQQSMSKIFLFPFPLCLAICFD